MLRATKIRLYPTPKQVEFLNAQFGVVRWMYNKALNAKTHFYRKRGVSLSPKRDLKPLLAAAKRSRKYRWLKEVDSQALQQAVINLEVVFQHFFNPKSPARFPKFKHRHGKQSSYPPNGKVLDGAIKVPKLTAINAKLHRSIVGEIKSITLSRTAAGKYFASILVEDGQTAPTKPKEIDLSRVVGCDLGIKDFLITSNGTKVANPRPYLKAQRNLRRKQKALSRKMKGSQNRAKARWQVAKCHEHIAHARQDFQHKLSRQLIDESQAVIVETLKSANVNYSSLKEGA